MTLVDTLTDDHRELDRLCRELLRAARMRDLDGAVCARAGACRALLRHVAREELLLHAPAIASGGATCALSRQFRHDMAAIGRRFADFTQDWTRDRIAGDWRGFTEAAELLIALLLRRLSAKAARLYPLVTPQPTRPTATRSATG